ncbi:MAG: hypothetical protein IJT95_07090 [Abditibacteriota bacterium]|nr:hypothetical protein [Abditibacteriota bacterium]
MPDNEIKHHYESMALYTFLDETAWEFCYTSGCNIAGTPDPTEKDWLTVLDDAEELSESISEHNSEEIQILLRHVARAERGFAIKKALPGMTDTELMGVLAAGEEDEETVMDSLGKAFEPDNNLDMFLLLTNGVSGDDPAKALRRAQTAARLAKYYFGEDVIYNDIMAAYGTCLIYLGKLQKATTIFDTIFEGDEMNLRSMVAICNALGQTDRKDIYKKYLARAIETAMALENDELTEDLAGIYRDAFPEEDAEEFNVNIHTLQEIEEMRHPEPEKIIWQNVQEMHPREMELLIEQSCPDEELDRHYAHIQKHARLSALVVRKQQPFYDAYREIYDKHSSEHKRQHELIEKFGDKIE